MRTPTIRLIEKNNHREFPGGAIVRGDLIAKRGGEIVGACSWSGNQGRNSALCLIEKQLSAKFPDGWRWKDVE